MDPIRNPFAPGAGNPPPELAGRATILEDARISLGRIAIGRSSPSVILVGLRGVGKTVLLNRMEELSQASNYLTEFVEVHENKSLPELLVPSLRQILFKLSSVEAAKEKARRGLRVLKGFLGSLKADIGGIEVGLSVSPEVGTADTGDIETDLPDLFLAVGEAAKAAPRPVCIILDELQYLKPSEFSALIMAIHRVSQRGLPLMMIGAGLPQILGLAGNSKSYAERLFRFPDIGALAVDDAMQAIRKPLADEGVEIQDDALEEILETTKSYPYFLQQWGHEVWNHTSVGPITLEDVAAATRNAIDELDQSFFKVRLDRCTNSEKKYMRALAELGEGPHRSGDIAEQLGVKVTSVAPTRNNLIRKGMIYSPSHGDTAFTVPLFDAFMRRVIPDIAENGTT